MESKAGFTQARLRALMIGNLDRHMRAKHNGLLDTRCRTCKAHRDAIERTQTAEKQIAHDKTTDPFYPRGIDW